MRTARALSASIGLMVVAATATPLQGQDVAEQIRTLARDNAQGYLEPVTSGLGAALTQGFYSSAQPHGVLGFDIGVTGVVARVPESALTFSATPPAQLGEFSDPYGSATKTSPTVLGEGEGALFEPQGAYRAELASRGVSEAEMSRCVAEGGAALCFPAGLGADVPVTNQAIPFAVIQAGVGLPFGTDVSLRFIPSVDLDVIGELSAFGVGARHSISQYLPSSPVDLSVMLNWQSMDFKPYLESSGTSMGIMASRDLPFLTLFAGLSRETANLDVSYTVDNPDLPQHGQTIAFEAEPDLGARFTAGATLNLLGLKLSGAYSLADYDVLSLKALLSFR